MKKTKGFTTKRMLGLVLSTTLTMSMLAPASATFQNPYPLNDGVQDLSLAEAPASTEGASFKNVTGDNGKDLISMTHARTFEAIIPVSMTAEELQTAIDAGNITYSLTRDEAFLSEDLYPNYVKGTTFEEWQTYTDRQDSTSVDWFKNIQSEVLVADDSSVSLKLTFDTEMFYVDGSMPHGTKGTLTMDYIGWYSLEAMNGTTMLGSVAAEVSAYDTFTTMGEIYDELDALANMDTDLYVEQFSMGTSTSGYDMPYLIIASNQADVDKWLDMTEKAESDPEALAKEIEAGMDYKVPVMFSNIHSNEAAGPDGILKLARMLVEQDTIDMKMLTGFTAEGEAQVAEERGEVGVEGSLAMPELVADTASLLGTITDTNNGISGPVDLAKYYTSETETVVVDEMLGDVFFILVPEQNVEGRVFMARVSSNGFDLNRDNSFQVTNETQNMQELIAKFNPILLTEVHGRVRNFQAEPCDPPHEPNFEYDLLANYLMTAGQAFGNAAISNNDGYNSYVIPQRDYLEYTGEKTADGKDETFWADPWDDMSTSYTPQFAMLQGTVAYTVELPAYNDDTVDATAYGLLGQSDYVADNKDDMMLNQLEIYARGVNNENSNEEVNPWLTNQYDVEGAEASLFRPVFDGEDENGNFYPEAYIIPMDETNQANIAAASEMLTWLSRNDVKISFLEDATVIEGIEYPEGTAIISMYQAKRSVANGALYDGTLIKDWTVLYSEGITTFNETRGFDMHMITNPETYKTIENASTDMQDMGEVAEIVEDIMSTDVASSETVIIMNNGEVAVSAVNDLLSKGKSVAFITDGDYATSFKVSADDYNSVADDYILTAVSADDMEVNATEISKLPLVYIAGTPTGTADAGYKYSNYLYVYNYSYDRMSLDLMGFRTTTDPSAADVIVGYSALTGDALKAVQNGTPYIGYGAAAVNSVVGSTDRDGNNNDGALFTYDMANRAAVSGSMDALAYVTYPNTNIINANYVNEGDEVMYGYGAGFFENVPAGSEVLVEIDATREPTEGFLRSSDAENLEKFLGGSTQAFSYVGEDKMGNDINVALFANSLTHKVNQRDEFSYISNFIFANMADAITEETPAPAGVFTDVTVADWFYDDVMYAYDNGIMNGTSATAFSPNATATRAMFATMLHRLAGEPQVELMYGNFADVMQGSWYEMAIAWASKNGIVSGIAPETVGVDMPVTREQLVTMLWRYEGEPRIADYEGLTAFSDIAELDAYAQSAMVWAHAEGIITGKSDTILAPNASATRAEISAIFHRYITLTGGQPVEDTTDDVEDATIVLTEEMNSETEHNAELANALLSFFGIPQEYQADTRYYYNYVDLDNDGTDEIFALLIGPYTSGSGGNSAAWVSADMEVIQAFTLMNAPLVITQAEDSSYSDIIVTSDNGTGYKQLLLTNTDGQYNSVNEAEELASGTEITGISILNDDMTYDEDKDYLTLAG